jgi:hypothetical protein
MAVRPPIGGRLTAVPRVDPRMTLFSLADSGGSKILGRQARILLL